MTDASNRQTEALQILAKRDKGTLQGSLKTKAASLVQHTRQIISQNTKSTLLRLQ